MSFAKNPVATIKSAPDWDWPLAIIFYAATAASSGVISGIISRHITRILSGLIVMPITSLISASIVTGVVYYTLVFLFQRDPPLRKVFIIVILSAVPALVLSIGSLWVHLLTVAGLLMSGLLLIVGISENFQISAKKFGKMVAGVYLVYLAFWVYKSIRFQSEKEKYKSTLTTPSRELLKQELEDSNGNSQSGSK